MQGHAWTTDYGNPDKTEEFEWIHPYSPLHNVRRPAGGSQQYPAVLVTTGEPACCQSLCDIMLTSCCVCGRIRVAAPPHAPEINMRRLAGGSQQHLAVLVTAGAQSN